MNQLAKVFMYGTLFGILASAPPRVHADGQPLVWDTGYGTVNLNLTASEAFIGYGSLKQAIAGLSQPVYATPKNIAVLQVGAAAPWPTNANAVEPYLAAGHDILREIPGLNQYTSTHLNVYGRYATTQGKADVGVSLSYSPLSAPPPLATVWGPRPSYASRLNLIPSNLL